MGVQFTQDAERERNQKERERRTAKWELLTTTSIVKALHFARDNGWYEKKVQVRATRNEHDNYEYSVEPWEKDCTCPDILKYSDYFDPS